MLTVVTVDASLRAGIDTNDLQYVLCNSVKNVVVIYNVYIVKIETVLTTEVNLIYLYLI